MCCTNSLNVVVCCWFHIIIVWFVAQTMCMYTTIHNHTALYCLYTYLYQYTNVYTHMFTPSIANLKMYVYYYRQSCTNVCCCMWKSCLGNFEPVGIISTESIIGITLYMPVRLNLIDQYANQCVPNSRQLMTSIRRVPRGKGQQKCLSVVPAVVAIDMFSVKAGSSCVLH